MNGKRIRIETADSVFFTTHIDEEVVRKEFSRICQEAQAKTFIEIVDENGDLMAIRTSLIQNICIYN